MILNDIGPDVLRSLKPQSIRLYLTSRGWNKHKSTATFDIFVKKDISEEILVPNSPLYSDYIYRMEDLLTSLSKVEKASPSYILMGLMLSSATDILEYRYEPENKEVGLIPIDREIEEAEYYNLMDCVYILDYHLKDSPVEMGAWVRLKSLLRGEHGVRL